MIYVSIDLETTGLDPERCQIIEMGAVVADSSMQDGPIAALPTFHTYVTQPYWTGESYALSMHSQIFRRIATKESGYSYIEPVYLTEVFTEWLYNSGVSPKIVVAGKNFGAFDLPFLRKFSGMAELFGHRFIDPAMLYFDPMLDERIPDLQTCLYRAGLGNREVSHTALEDAQDVVRVLNGAFKGKQGAYAGF